LRIGLNHNSTKASKSFSEREATAFVCFVFFVVPKTRGVLERGPARRLSKMLRDLLSVISVFSVISVISVVSAVDRGTDHS